MKLPKYEVDVLKLVSELGPCGETVIHSKTDGALSDIQKDLGDLSNRGYVLYQNKQWSITAKGQDALTQSEQNAVEVSVVNAKVYAVIEKHQPVTKEDIIKMSELGNDGSVEAALSEFVDEGAVTWKENEGYRICPILNDYIVATALGELEKQLALQPVKLNSVESYELKLQVLSKLSNLLDPSIGSILDDIQADLNHLQDKAA